MEKVYLKEAWKNTWISKFILETLNASPEKLPHELQNPLKDENGKYIEVELKINGTEYSLSNFLDSVAKTRHEDIVERSVKLMKERVGELLENFNIFSKNINEVMREAAMKSFPELKDENWWWDEWHA